MNLRVDIFPRVWQDLEEVADRIGKDNMQAADRFCDAAQLCFRQLAQTPKMGAPRFYQALSGNVRIWPVTGFDKWLIFYREFGDCIEIIRVIHAARDIQAIFSEAKDHESPS